MSHEFGIREQNQMRCACYVRYSSDMQRKATLEDQERQCRKFAEEKGWMVLDDFVRSDAGKSGTSLMGRDGLNSLIIDAKRRPSPFQMLLIDDTSRLGRNTRDVLDIVDMLVYHEVHVYFVSQRLDSREPENFQMALTIHSMMDQQYITRLAKNVWRGQEGRVRKGFTSGSRCFGYRSVRVEAPSSKGAGAQSSSEGTRLEIIESEAQTIRRICEMFAGGMSAHKIMRILNAEKVPAARKPTIGNVPTSWNHNLITRILQNERYIGMVVWNRTKQYKDRMGRIELRAKPQSEVLRVPTPHLRIVSDELWNRVQDRLKIVNEQVKAHRLGGLNRVQDKTYLFSGLLKCGVCGESMVITGGKGSEASYGCKLARYTRGCSNNLRIRQDRLAAQLVRALGENLLRPKMLDYLVEQVCADLNEQLQREHKIALAESGEELAQRKTELETRIENLLDQIEQTSLSESSGLKARYAKRRAELAAVNQKINARRNPVKVKVSVADTRRLVAEQVNNLLEVCQVDIDKARQMLQEFIHTLILIPAESPEGPVYEVMGDVDLFAGGDGPSSRVMLEDLSTQIFQHYESFRHWFAGIQIDPRLVEESEKGPTNANALCDLLVDLLQREPGLAGKSLRAREWAAHFAPATGYKEHFLEPKNMHYTLRTHPDAFLGKVLIRSRVDNSGTRWYSFRLPTVVPCGSTALPSAVTAMEVPTSIAT